MDLQSFLTGLGDKREALVKKALQCQNQEELLSLAEENGVALDEAGAAELFAAVQANYGKMSDDDIDAVAGGANKANNVRCNDCGNEFHLMLGTRPAPPLLITPMCPKCNSKNLSNI